MTGIGQVEGRELAFDSQSWFCETGRARARTARRVGRLVAPRSPPPTRRSSTTPRPTPSSVPPARRPTLLPGWRVTAWCGTVARPGATPIAVPFWGVWPQTSLEEAEEAQRRADAGDPAFTWQLAPELAAPPESESFPIPGARRRGRCGDRGPIRPGRPRVGGLRHRHQSRSVLVRGCRVVVRADPVRSRDEPPVPERPERRGLPAHDRRHPLRDRVVDGHAARPERPDRDLGGHRAGRSSPRRRSPPATSATTSGCSAVRAGGAARPRPSWWEASRRSSPPGWRARGPRRT